jgi:hypothetical protein
VTALPPLRVGRADELEALNSGLHDDYLDLSAIRCAARDLVIPLAREVPRKRWIGRTSTPAQQLRWADRLVLRDVDHFEVEDDQGIDMYSINRVLWDAEASAVVIETNQRAALMAETEAPNLSIETTQGVVYAGDGDWVNPE